MILICYNLVGGRTLASPESSIETAMLASLSSGLLGGPTYVHC